MTPVVPASKAELIQNLKLSCNSLLDKKAEDLKLLYFGDKSPLIYRCPAVDQAPGEYW